MDEDLDRLMRYGWELGTMICGAELGTMTLALSLAPRRRQVGGYVAADLDTLVP
jgi:hypothetical protein